MVIVSLDSLSPWVQAMADATGLKVVSDPPPGYYLSFENGEWLVRDPRQGAKFSLSVDAAGELAKLQAQRLNPKKDLLSRALGFRGQESYRVFDSTFGFGRDSLHMLAQGCSIIGCEAHPVVFALVSESFAQLSLPPSKLTLAHGDSLNEVAQHVDSVDCLYLDPMFENAKKKSAPKKHMAFLREVEISPSSPSAMVAQAIKLGVKRVVVKRPINGDHLYRTPQNIMEGKLVRYDIYLR